MKTEPEPITLKELFANVRKNYFRSTCTTPTSIFSKLLLPTQQSICLRLVDTHNCSGGNHTWFNEPNNQGFQRGNKLIPISSECGRLS